MVFKVVTLALLVACTQAIHYDGHAATSSIIFNDNHNSIQHIQSPHAAPSHHGYSAPLAHYSPHAAPVAHYAAPVAQYAAPVAQYSAPAAQYAAPIAQYAAPVAQYAAPVAQYAAPAAQYAAPAAHYAAPIVKVAAPVFHKSAAPSQEASSYSSLSFGHGDHHESANSHYAIPVAKIGAPANHASSYSSYAAPTAHIAPVAKLAIAPVAVAHAAPAYHNGGYGVNQHHEEQYTHPKYEFSYGVEDHHTGDIHSHKEARDGDVTHGEYSLHEADGTIRTVKYTVDKHSGFNAVVERSGPAAHAQPSKAIVAAPIIKAPAPYYHH